MKSMGLSTPEGYFEGLKKELKSIPKQHPAPKPANQWKLVFRYAAIAAAAAVLVTAGSLLLDRSAGHEAFPEYDYMMYADEMTNIVFQDYKDQYAEAYEITEDDIIEYLISSDVEIEDIEQYLH